MNGTDTQLLTKDQNSTVFGVSIRGWMAIILVMTVALTQILVTAAVVYDAIANKDFSKVGTFSTIGEPLYSLSIAALSFYFGQKTSTKT